MKTITATEVKKRLDSNDILLIDVREPVEHKNERIEGACLIPLGEISLEKLPSKSRPVVLHCRSGKRSADACAKLLAQDPELDVYSLEGGIVAWQQAGFQVSKPATNMLPIDQQTHFAVGFVAFVGTLLGAFVNADFYILPGAIGLGLMFAGLTGWCGMTKLLTKMPWNR